MGETVPAIDARYKKNLVIGCVLILIGLVFSLVIHPLYAHQMYELGKKREEGDLTHSEYSLKRNEASLWYGYGMLISKGIIVGGCFLAIFTCITLFFDRKTPLEATERLGLLVLIGFLLLIALWFGVSLYPLTFPFFY